MGLLLGADKISLNQKQKLDLIKHLVLIGSIIVVFESPTKQVENWINIFFLLFLFSSLVYYVKLQTELNTHEPLEKKSGRIDWYAFFPASTFIITICSVFGGTLMQMYGVTAIVATFIYALVFLGIIYNALD